VAILLAAAAFYLSRADKMNAKITGLKVQKKNRQRVNVFLDGEFAFGLSRITAGWLHVGQELSDEKIAELKEHDAFEVAYQRTLKFMEFRERSSTEIRRYLKKNEVSDEISERVIERLKEAGLLDDSRFAQMWIENRNEFRPRSIRALRMEMRQHGIDEELIDRSLETVDEHEIAYKAARKYARKLENLEWQDFRQKLYGYLGRRGFNYETSADVIRKVWDENFHPQIDE
jgi:regulatory protein